MPLRGCTCRANSEVWDCSTLPAPHRLGCAQGTEGCATNTIPTGRTRAMIVGWRGRPHHTCPLVRVSALTEHHTLIALLALACSHRLLHGWLGWARCHRLAFAFPFAFPFQRFQAVHMCGQEHRSLPRSEGPRVITRRGCSSTVLCPHPHPHRARVATGHALIAPAGPSRHCAQSPRPAH